MDPLMAAALGGLAGQMGGAAGNWFSQGLFTGNWGGTSDERKNVVTDTRKLRKTAYQDMVFSLKEAGLNPMLAVGASPGYSAAPQVAQPQYQGNPGFNQSVNSARQVGVAEGKMPSEIKENEAGAALKDQNRIVAQLGIPSLLQQFELNQATIDKVRNDTAVQKLLGEVYRADAIMKGASAREIDQRIGQIDKFGLPGQSWEGILRQLLTDETTENSAKSWWDTIKDGINDKGKQQQETEGFEWGTAPGLVDLYRYYKAK